MTSVIFSHGLVGTTIAQEEDASGVGFVKSYDLEAHGGQGEVEFSAFLKEALRFPSTAAAWEFVMQTPKSRPTRPDGQPNRPIRAFTLEVLSFDKEPDLDES